MVFKGCERSVITYSSLISACEKAGQSDLAMELFQEMAQEGCVPNTVTYNSLITACAQGRAPPPSRQPCNPFQRTHCLPQIGMADVSSLSPACHPAVPPCALGISPHLSARSSQSAHPLKGPASRCLTMCRAAGSRGVRSVHITPQVEQVEAGSGEGPTPPGHDAGGQWQKAGEIFQQMQWQRLAVVKARCLLGAMQAGSGRRRARCSSRCSGRA